MTIKFYNQLIKIALPIQVEPVKEELRGKGWLFDPKGATTPQSLSIKKSLKKLGLGNFSLPKFYRVKEKDIRQINGQPYIIVQIDPPKLYKILTKAVSEERKTLMIPIDPPDANGNKFLYPGRIMGINLNTGDVEGFTHAEVWDSIKSQAIELSEKTRLIVNKKIKLINDKIEKIDQETASLANLPLQLTSAQVDVNKRIEVIDAIINATKQEIQEVESKRPTEFETYVHQQIGSGQLEEKDFTDYVLTEYSDKYAKLIEDLNNNTLVIPQNIPNPEEYKQKLLNIAQISLDKQIAEEQKEEKEKEPFDISQAPEVAEILEIQPGELRTQQKAKGAHSFESWMGSLWHIVKGEEKDKADLSKISTMLGEIAKEIGRLGEGQRKIEYLQTPDGQVIVEYLKTLCNQGLKGFTERYAKDLVDEDGRLNYSLFSGAGKEGNAGLITTFIKLYRVIAILFKKASLPPPVMPASPVISIPPTKETTKLPSEPEPTKAEPPIKASSNKMIIKISKSNWKKLG